MPWTGTDMGPGTRREVTCGVWIEGEKKQIHCEFISSIPYEH